MITLFLLLSLLIPDNYVLTSSVFAVPSMVLAGLLTYSLSFAMVLEEAMKTTVLRKK